MSKKSPRRPAPAAHAGRPCAAILHPQMNARETPLPLRATRPSPKVPVRRSAVSPQSLPTNLMFTRRTFLSPRTEYYKQCTCVCQAPLSSPPAYHATGYFRPVARFQSPPRSSRRGPCASPAETKRAVFWLSTNSYSSPSSPSTLRRAPSSWTATIVPSSALPPKCLMRAAPRLVARVATARARFQLEDQLENPLDLSDLGWFKRAHITQQARTRNTSDRPTDRAAGSIDPLDVSDLGTQSRRQAGAGERYNDDEVRRRARTQTVARARRPPAGAFPALRSWPRRVRRATPHRGEAQSMPSSSVASHRRASSSAAGF